MTLRPTAQPTRVPARGATDSGLFFEADWSDAPADGEPAWFLDPAKTSGDHPYWLSPGQWRVTRLTTPAYTGLAYQASEERPQPWLSFRVLQRPSVPSRFRILATVQGVSSPYLQSPIGEISIIPYYLDPTHYMEVLVTPAHLGIWLADGAEPDTDRGWTGVHFLPVRTDVGQLRQVTIDVDLSANRLTVAAGDQTYTLTHPFLQPDRGHGLAVRAAGNTFNLLRYRVETTP
ncbi:MAG: hypothetical protein H7338_25445 [Candidatus Sericytochromatia bacterium]|nr:hypothetical protein [Candidatus Sericytochromatia bacterium]